MKRTTHNAIVNIAGEATWGISASLIASATVLTLTLQSFGANSIMIGSIVAIESGLIILPQILGIYIFRSRRKRKMQIVIWHWVVMLPMLAAISGILWFSPHFSPGAVRWAVLILFACFILSIGTVMAVWMDWMACLFPVQKRGTVMGIGFGLSALMGTLGTLFVGELLRTHQSARTFSILYACACVVGFISLAIFVNIKETFDADQPDSLNTTNPRELIAKIWESLSHVPFKTFILARILMSAGFSMMPFVTIYYMSKDGGGLTPNIVVWCSAAQTAGIFIANIGAGRLGDIRGHKAGMLIGTIAQIVALAILCITAGPISALCAFLGAGLGMGSCSISHYNMMFETCPHDNRIAHITAGNLIFSLGTIAVPIMGGFVAESFGVKTLFGGSLCVSVIALFVIVLFVKEPRKAVV